MAAASGPVQTSTGETMEIDETRPTEEPTPPPTEGSDEFKMPDINLPRPEKKKTESPTPATKESDRKSSEKKQAVSQPQSLSLKQSRLSPAEQLKQSQVSIPYKEPIWGGIPPDTEKYSLEVLKSGTVIDNIELGQKPWIVFGRLPSCDVFMEHPSLSRHHAVVQYRETPEDGFDRGWYLYDLDSTHGTWVNKVKVKPKQYHRLHVGHVIKFGGSSRLYILQGPEEDREPESELSVTELKEKTAILKREAELLQQAEQEKEEEEERQRQKILELRGCSWGMGEDAIEEEPGENPFVSAVPEHEHLYRDDPKKALKGFYEREGCDLPDYQFTEVGFGKHKCVVELPVDAPNGEPLIAEATVSGKKKDAVIACALEACRLLDIHGLLHAAKHESRKRKGKNWEEDDFYDSDEDTFLDRTGTIEKKRLLRMQKSGKDTKAETYETLLPKHEEVVKRITEIETQLEQAKAQTEAMGNEEEDALDAYMSAIKAGVMDTKTRLSLKRELLTLRTEEQRLRRLVNIAKPATLPEIKKQITPAAPKQPAASSLMSGVRKIGVPKGPKRPVPLPVHQPMQTDDSNFVEEEDEDDDEEEDNKSNTSQDVKPQQSPSTKASIPSGKDTNSVAKKPEMDEPRDSSSKSIPKDRDCQKGSVSASFPSRAEAKKSSVPKSASSQKSDKGAALPEAWEQPVKGPTLPPDFEQPVKGPTLPPDFQIPASEKADTSSQEESPKSKKESRPPTSKKKKTADLSKGDYDASDPAYAVWMPPEGQTGDGRTSLNDKLGY